MKKSDAILIVNSYLKQQILNNKNTNFSKINESKPVWWFNIPPIRFRNDLHLLLLGSNQLIWLKIPANSISNPDKYFRIRKDKNLVDIEISNEPGVYKMRDVKSGGTGFNFETYVIKIIDI